jgi:hypothetical protein
MKMITMAGIAPAMSSLPRLWVSPPPDRAKKSPSKIDINLLCVILRKRIDSNPEARAKFMLFHIAKPLVGGMPKNSEPHR